MLQAWARPRPGRSSRRAAGGRSARWRTSPGGRAWAAAWPCGWPRRGPSARWGSDRRGALWHALAHDPKDLPADRPLLAGTGSRRPDAGRDSAACRRPKRCWPIIAPRACRYRRTRWSSFAPGLDRLGVVPARQLADVAQRRAGPRGRDRAGPAAARHRQGDHLRHLGRRDRHGQPDHPARRLAAFPPGGLGATVLLAQGRLQRHGQVIHVLVGRLEDLSPRLAELALSRGTSARTMKMKNEE